MRVLWVPSAQPGSLYPIVPVALELARRGHDVTALCEAASQSTFEELGFGFRPASELDAALAAFDPAAHGGGRAAKDAWHATYVRSLFADVQRELAAARYDVALVDPLEPGATFGAEAAGVPAVSYVHWRMNETGPDVPFSFHFWSRERPADEEFADWWNEQRGLVELGPDGRPSSASRWYRCSPDLTLLLGLPELAHPQGELPSYAVRVGPTPWLPAAAEPVPVWLDEIGRDRPAVLASISTVGADARLLTALGRAVDGEDVDVIATVPVRAELPALPPNVRPVPFIPHAAVMPRVAVVVSHAGNGTVTHAACAGVPLLLMPEGRDQFEVARGAVAAGIAIELGGDADTATIRDALRRLREDAAYRERAQALAARASQYEAPTVASDALEALVPRR